MVHLVEDFRITATRKEVHLCAKSRAKRPVVKPRWHNNAPWRTVCRPRRRIFHDHYCSQTTGKAPEHR